MRPHPTTRARINPASLADLVAEVGLARAALVERAIAPHTHDGWLVDTGLTPPATLHQAGVQVAFRVPGHPLRHLPLTLEEAKLWAAAWLLRLAQDAGHTADAIGGHLAARFTPTQGTTP